MSRQREIAGPNPGAVLDALERANREINTHQADCPSCQLNFGNPALVGAASRMAAHWLADHLAPDRNPETPVATSLQTLALAGRALEEAIGEGPAICTECGVTTAGSSQANRDNSLTRHWAENHWARS